MRIIGIFGAFKSGRKFCPAALALFFAAACSDGGSSTPAPTPSPTPSPTVTEVTISGQVTFDYVPISSITNGLNYAATSQRAARGVVVEARDASGAIITSTVADASGRYALVVPANSDVRIRVRAELSQTGSPSWTATVRDNTNSNAAYYLSGALADSGSANSTRNLNAPSGWGGTSYTGVRAAAPFAILDVLYDAFLFVNAAAPAPIDFDDLQVYWSEDNRAVDGDVADGEISSTSFTFLDNTATILVLGAENSDTDEYDREVLAHEFFHYVENTLARSDSIGGAHSLDDRLDPRVALSEGFANAFSGFVLGDPVYRDTGGTQQSSGFSFSVEDETTIYPGWFSETSVQALVWDFVDSNQDTGDLLDLEFSDLYDALTDAGYAGSDAPVMIYLFADLLAAAPGVDASDVASMLAAQSIFGSGPYGDLETNDGGFSFALPVVKTVLDDGAPITICSYDDAGDYNKLGNRALIRFTAPTTRLYSIAMTTASGPTGRDPDFYIFRQGAVIDAGLSVDVDSETAGVNLEAGDYWFDAYDYYNTQPDDGTPADVCFDFSVN